MDQAKFIGLFLWNESERRDDEVIKGRLVKRTCDAPRREFCVDERGHLVRILPGAFVIFMSGGK